MKNHFITFSITLNSFFYYLVTYFPTNGGETPQQERIHKRDACATLNLDDVPPPAHHKFTVGGYLYASFSLLCTHFREKTFFLLIYSASKLASFAMPCTSGVASVAFIFFLNFFSVLSLTVNSGLSTIVA